MIACVASVLVGRPDGVKGDDYETFIRRRARAIAVALNLKLMSITPAEASNVEKSA